MQAVTGSGEKTAGDLAGTGTMHDLTGSPGPERRTLAERRHGSRTSLYDRLDETIRKIEAERRAAGRRREESDRESVRAPQPSAPPADGIRRQG